MSTTTSSKGHIEADFSESTGFSSWVQEMKNELNVIPIDISSPPSLQEICLQQLASYKMNRDSLMPLYSHVRYLAVKSIWEGMTAKLDVLKRKLESEIVDFYPFYREREPREYIEECLGNVFLEKCEQALIEREQIKKTLVVSTKAGQIIERELYPLQGSQQGFYPYEALKQGMRWPDDVDVARREQYLTDTEFEDVFSMKKFEFNGLDKHKRLELKKKFKLF